MLGSARIIRGEIVFIVESNDSSLHWDLLVMVPTVTANGVPLLDSEELVL